MIWNLAIQQARATARYTRAAAIFMTMGVATLTLAVGVASTQQHIESDANDIATGVMPHVERVSTLFGPDTPGGPASPVVAQDVPRDFPITTIAESDAWVSRALTAGSPVTAWRETLLRPLVRNDGDSFAQGVAATGEFDWEAALVEGEAPEPGEVVLSISAARVFDVGIGDAVTFTRASNLHGEAPPIPAFTVSGLSRSAVEGDSTFYSFAPDAYFNWADSSTVTGPFAQYVRASSSPDATSNDEPFIAAPETSLAWSGDSSTFPEPRNLARGPTTNRGRTAPGSTGCQAPASRRGRCSAALSRAPACWPWRSRLAAARRVRDQVGWGPHARWARRDGTSWRRRSSRLASLRASCLLWAVALACSPPTDCWPPRARPSTPPPSRGSPRSRGRQGWRSRLCRLARAYRRCGTGARRCAHTAS